MFSCKEATQLASDQLDRPLTLGQRTKLYLHLAICSHCRRFSAQIAYLSRAIRAYTTWAGRQKLSKDQRDRLQERLRQEQSEPRDKDPQ